MEKITLERFRFFKSYLRELAASMENYNDSQLDYYVYVLEQLFSFDLSHIDSEEWRGICFYSLKDKVLDLSKSFPNLDFSFIKINLSSLIDFHGCNIKNIDSFPYYLDRSFFDIDKVTDNPDCFFDSSVPE